MVTRFDDFVRGLLAQANQTARRVRAQPPVAQMADLLAAALGASAAAGGPLVGAAPPAAAGPAAAPDPAAILGELAKVPLPTPGQRLPPQAFVDLRPPPDVSLAEMQRQAAEALAPAEQPFVPMDPAVVSLVIDQQFAEAGQTPTTAMREIAPESQPGFIPEVSPEEALPPHLVEARPQRKEAERRTPTVAPPIVERQPGAWDNDIRARVAQGGLEQANTAFGPIEHTLTLDGLDPTLRQSLEGTRTALIEQSHKLQEMRQNPWKYSPQEVSLEADLTETYAELAKTYAAIAKAEGQEREPLIQAAHELGAAITETRRLLDAYRAPDGDERAQAEIAQARQAFLEMAEQYPEVEREYTQRLGVYLDAQKRYEDAQAAAAQDPTNQGLQQAAAQAQYDLLEAQRALMPAEQQLQMLMEAGVPEYLAQRESAGAQLLGPLTPVFNALDWLRRQNVAQQGELAYRHATGQGPAVSSFELQDIRSLEDLGGELFEQIVGAVSNFPEWANDPKNRELIKQVYEQGYWSEDGQFFRGGAAVWEYYIGQQPWYRRAIEDLANDPLNWAALVAAPAAGGLRAMAAGVQATNPRLARTLRVAARLTEVATDPTAPITDRPISAAVVALRDRVLRRLPGVRRALAPTEEAVYLQTRTTAEDALAFLRQQEEAVMAAAPEPGLGQAGTTSAGPSTVPETAPAATTTSAPGVTGGPATATTPASAAPAETAQPTTAPGTTSAGMTAPAGTTTATSPTTTPAAPEPRVTKTKTGRAIQVGDERATISRTAGGEYAIRIDRRVVERVGTEQEALERATDLLADRWRAKQPVTATPAIPVATPADPFAGTALARDRAPVIGGQPVTVETVGDRAYRILAPGDELRAYWDERAQRFAVTRERDGISQLLGTARTEAEVADLVVRELERRASAAAPLEAPEPLVEAAEAEVAAPAPEPTVRVTELEAPGARRRYQARGQEVIDTETGQRVARAPSPEAARQEAARRNLMERPAVLVEVPESALVPPRTGEATEAVAPEPASRDVAPRTEATGGAPDRTEAGNLVERIGENQYRVSDRFSQVYVFAGDRGRWYVTSEPPDRAPQRLALGRQTLEEALRHADTRLSEARKSLEPQRIRPPRTFHVSSWRNGYAVYEVIGNRWERISSRFRTQEAAEAAAARLRNAEVRRVEQAVEPILSPNDPTAGPTTLDLDTMTTYTRLRLPDGQEVRIEADAGVQRDDPFWTVSTRDNLLGEYLTYDEAYRLATERLGARVEGAPGAVPESPAPGMRTVRTEAGDQGVLPGLGDAARPVFGEPATGRLEAPTGGPAEPLRLEVQVLETPEAQREAQRLAGQQELPLGEPAPEPRSGWETVPRVEVAPDEAPYAVVRRIEPAWVDAGNGMVRGRVIIGGRRFETATTQNPATTDLAAVTRSGRAWVEVDPTGAPIGPRASLEVHVARVQAEPMPATAAQDADTLAGAPPAPSQAPGREVAASEAAPARPRASELAPGWTERSPSGYPMVRLAENAHLIVGEQSRVIVEPSGDAWAITGVTDSGLRSPQGTAPTRDAAVALAEDYLRTVDSTERLASDLPTAPSYEVRERRRGRAVVYDLYQRDGLKPIHTFRSRAEAEQVISQLYDIQSRMAAPGAYREDAAPAPVTAAEAVATPPEAAAAAPEPTPESRPAPQEAEANLFANRPYQRRVVDLAQIRTRPDFQPRQALDPERVDELVQTWDFRRYEPIKLWRAPDGQLYVMAGHHRLAAMSRLAETDPMFRNVDAFVYEGLSEQEARDLALASNTQTAGMAPSELARLVHRELARGLPPTEQSFQLIRRQHRHFRTVGEVKRAYRIGLLPRELQDLVDGGTLPANIADHLARGIEQGIIDEAEASVVYRRYVVGKDYSATDLDHLFAAMRRAKERVPTAQLGLFGERVGGDLAQIETQLDALRQQRRQLEQIRRAATTTIRQADALGLSETARGEIAEGAEQVIARIHDIERQLFGAEQTTVPKVIAELAEKVRKQASRAKVEVRADPEPVGPVRGADPIPPPDGQPWVRATDASETVVRSGDRTVVIQRTPDGFRVVDSDAPDATVETLDAAMALLADRGVLSGSRIQTGSAITVVEHGPTIDLSIDGLTVRVRERNGRWVIEGTGPNGEALILREGIADRGVALREAEGELIGAYAERVRRGKARLSERATKTGRTWTIAGERRYGPTRLTVRSVRRGGEDVWEFVTDTGQRAIIPRADLSEANLDAVAERVLRDPMGDGQGRLNPDLAAERATLELADQRIVTAETPAQPEAQRLADDLGLLTQREDATPTVRTEADERAGYAWYLNPERVVWLRELERVRPGIWEEKIKPRLLEWLKGPEARLFKRYFGEPTHEEARARLRRLGVPEERIRELTDPTQELERRLEQRFGTAPMDGPIAEAMYAAVIKQVADEEGIQLSVFSGKAFWTDPSYLTPHGGDGVLESWRVGRYNPDGDATWVWRLIWTPDENAAVATHARRLMYQHGLIDRDAYHGAAKPFDREAATARARRGDVTWERTDRVRRRVTVKDLRRQLGSDEAAVQRWVEIEERRYVEAVRRAEAIRRIRQVLHGGERPVSVAPREGPFVAGDPVDAPTQVRKRLYPVYDQRGYVVATASSREEAERIAATLSESYWLIPNERKRELGELFPSLREAAGGRGRLRGDANLYLVHPAVARFLRHSLRHAPTLSNPNRRFLDLLPPDVEEVLQWRFQGVVDPELRGLTLAEVAVDFGLEAQTHQRLYQKLHALGVRPEHYRGSRPPTLRLRRKPKPGVSDPDLALLGGSYEETMAALHNLYARFGLDIMNDAPALLGDVRAAYAIARDRAPNAGRQLPLVLDLVHALLFRAPIHLAIATPFNLAYDIRNMLSNITAHAITMRGLDRIINVADWWKAFRDVPSNVDRLTEELGIGLPALLRTPEAQRRPIVGGIGVSGDIITAGRETPTRRLSQRLRVTEPVAQAFDWKREFSGRLELAARRASYATLLSAEVAVRKGQFIDEMTAQVQRFLPGITEEDIELVVLNLTSDLGAFSPHLAYQGFYDFAISKGLAHDVAENLGDQAYRRWAGMVRQASQRSLERLNQIYPHRITETKLDRFLQHIVFFHFWPSRMIVFMLDEMFRDPRLAVNAMRAYQSIMRESEQDADLRHGSVRTSWFTKLLGLGQTPFGLFFMADLRTLFLVSELLPQVREDRELPNTTLAYKELERWSRRLGGIGLTPFTYGALNTLGVFGDAPIRPIWNSRELQLAGAVADWLLTETGHDRGSPVYRQFYQNFREKLSGLIPGTVHVPADEAGGSLEDLIRSQIIADNPDLRAKLESASETIRLEGLAEVERILENPRDPRYQRAELAVVRAGAAQRLLNLIVPFSLSFSVPGRQETIRLARLGREGVTLPAAQAAVDERLAATASPELLSLRVQQRQLQRVGTPEQRTAVDMYRRIRNGELTGTITIGGSAFTAEQVRQAPQEVRDFLATYWAMEHGLQDEIDAYYASREEMLASPEFAEYRAYTDWSRQMRERGIAQAREELMRISPNYRRYIESLPEEVRADPEALDAASVSVRAYLAQKGVATSVYDRPAAATDVSQVPASAFVLGQTGEERGQGQERGEQSAGERFLRDLARYQEDLAAANVVLQRLTGQPGLTFDQLDPLSRQAFEYHVARFGVRVPSKPASVEQYERWAAERRKQGLPADALTYALLLDQTGEQPASEVFGSDLASLLQLASGPMLDPATILMLQQLGLAPSGGLANLPDYYGGSQRDPFAGTAIARPIVGYGASGPPADVLGISIRDPFLGTRYGR